MSEEVKPGKDREEVDSLSHDFKRVEISRNNDDTDDVFAWSVPIAVDKSAERMLNSNNKPVPEDASIPRETIAEELRGFRFLAGLERPIRIGKYNNATAYLLCLSISFQDMQLSSSSRIKHASIVLTFDDAPVGASTDNSDGSDDAFPPAILKIYPELYEGPLSTASMETSAELALSLSGGIGPLQPSGTVAQKKSWVQTGRLVVHGSPLGRPVKHEVAWKISENPISKLGIPKIIRLSLIVRPRNRRRFSAKLRLHASYGVWRGPLASMVPVLGKNEDPIYFDPLTLEDMAKHQKRSRFDGKIVAVEAGDLHDYELNEPQFFQLV